MSEYIVKIEEPISTLFYERNLKEIVRCRDCKYMHTVRHWLGMDVDECWLHAVPESGALGKEPTEPDGFCAWAEKKVTVSANGEKGNKSWLEKISHTFTITRRTHGNGDSAVTCFIPLNINM